MLQSQVCKGHTGHCSFHSSGFISHLQKHASLINSLDKLNFDVQHKWVGAEQFLTSGKTTPWAIPV